MCARTGFELADVLGDHWRRYFQIRSSHSAQAQVSDLHESSHAGEPAYSLLLVVRLVVNTIIMFKLKVNKLALSAVLCWRR